MKETESEFHYYNKKLRTYANNLRKDMTKAEACTWKYLLKARMMKGYQFRRQRPVLNYIADFMCKELCLIIEIDGITHSQEETCRNDQIRQKKLEEHGFTILRYTDEDILNHMENVRHHIEKWIERNAKVPPPNPRQRGKK